MGSPFTDGQERTLREIARKLARRSGYDFDDVLSCVWLVAHKNHPLFDESRGNYRDWAIRWVYRKARFLLTDEQRPVHVSVYRYTAGARAPRASMDDATVPACSDSPLDEVERSSSRAALVSAMSTLTPREQIVVARYYGLTGSEPELMPQLGAELGCCKERVKQIRDAALDKIRQNLHKMGCCSSDL